MNDLSPEELARYSRHLILPEVGREGQEKFKAAKVLLVGAGGLGSPLALYLAAGGVGTLGLVDFDVVDFSNLQRQIIHFTSDVGKPKLVSASEKIRAINPNVDVRCHAEALTSSNAMEILAEYDIIIDGTDNFPTRYLVNDACVLLGKPNVYGSIFRFEGQASVFHAQEGPCYRCLFPEPPPPGMVPSCAEGGVLGILPGVIGALQATECMKLILGKGTTLIGRLVLYDALHMRFRELKVRKDPACPLCGQNPTIRELVDYEAFCGVAPTEGLAQVPTVSVQDFAQSRDGALLLDVREPGEVEVANIEGSHLIPLGQLSERLQELDPGRKIVVYCRSGKRSAVATQILLGQGFSDVQNLDGGILAWAAEIDPTMTRY